MQQGSDFQFHTSLQGHNKQNPGDEDFAYSTFLYNRTGRRHHQKCQCLCVCMCVCACVCVYIWQACSLFSKCLFTFHVFKYARKKYV